MGELSQLDQSTMLALVSNGDCAKLSQDQRLTYYRARCDAAGLDPRTQPFQYVQLGGRLVLYALKGATDQLASRHGIVAQVLSQVTEMGVRTVTVRAAAKDGRQTDDIGCVSVENLKGEALCNALMKAVTKAKRRAILSLCGLGMTDESELETIHGAEPIPMKPAEIVPPPQKTKKPKAEPPSPPAETPKTDKPIDISKLGEDVQASEPLVVPDTDGKVDPANGIKEGDHIKLEGHLCAVCTLTEWEIRRARPGSTNAGRLYLACLKGCKNPKRPDKPSMGGFVDEVMPKYLAAKGEVKWATK